MALLLGGDARAGPAASGDINLCYVMLAVEVQYESRIGDCGQ